MKIKSIQLCNFRQYKGEQPAILFSTDDEKNVTVILGINTSGKTTLIQAFRWCLYGGKSCSFKTKEVLNAEVEEDMNPLENRKVSVEIVLVHEGREYTIWRTQTFKINEMGRLKAEDEILKIQYKEDNGEQQGISAHDTAKTINKILPEGLSDYFFFDGERISDINNRSDVVAAVRGLMGLDVIGEARDRLDPSSAKSVTSKLTKELDTGSDQEGANLSQKLTEVQEKREGLIARIKEAESEIEYFENRKTELSQMLLDNEQSKQNQQRRETLEHDVEHCQTNIKQAETRIKSEFQRGALSFFALPLLECARKTIDDSKQDGEGIPEMRQAAIDYILERNYCICGCDLEENQGARKRIESEKKLLPPAHIGTLLRTQKGKYLQFEEASKGYVQVVIESHSDFRRNIRYLDEKQEELDDVSKEIADSPNVDVVKIEKDYADNEKSLEDKRELFKHLNQQIGATDNEIDSIEKRIDSLTVTSEKNRKLKRYIMYSKAIFGRFDKAYSEKETEVKEKLLESVNRIFSKMYHGQRTVSLNDKYQIILSAQLNTSKKQTDESKGLEAVKNFSFIAGLVDLARQKIQDASSGTEDELDKELRDNTEPYPLVMDAPFSNADEIHISNISRIIPDIAEQVILIVMKKDWDIAKESLEEKVGRRYLIEKINNSETNSIVRGGDESV